MGQKQITRSRSKSGSRKTLVDTKSENTPIIPNKRKSVKNDNEKDNGFNVYRRVTRQSLRVTSKTSLDDSQQDDLIHSTSNNDVEDITESDSNEEINVENHEEIKNTYAGSIFKSLYSIIFIIFVPILILYLNKICENGGILRVLSIVEIKMEFFTNCEILGLVGMWLLFLSCLSVLPIGNSRIVSLSNGFQLRYRCNGMWSLLVSTSILSWLLYFKYLTATLIYDNYYTIIGSSITVSLIISLIIYLKSFTSKTHLETNSGNIPYCFLMGREINPRLLGLDLKYFYEFRPGLISWALLNVIYCVKDWEEHECKSINLTLLLCATSQFIYCFDSLLFEGDVISKAFMLNGKFGFVHCFGSQVIVPFLFTLTSRAIQINKMELPIHYLAIICLINLIGFVIYRSSNSQKSDFRKNPYDTHIYHLKTITTEYGRQILAGGWWGILRHPNYLGDVIMSICWSLCSGSFLAICWFYPLYFVVFIVSRCIEDERNCSIKHGEAWQEYRRSVPYRILPFIF